MCISLIGLVLMNGIVFFKTDEGIKFGKKVYALADAINREFLKIIDY